MKLNATHAT